MVTLYTENWEINDIDTVFFDKDGTFIDSNPYWGKLVELRVLEVMKQYSVPKDKFNYLAYSLGYDTKSKKLINKAPIAILSREDVIKTLITSLDKINVASDFDLISEIFNKVHKDFLQDMYKYTVKISEAVDLIKKLKDKNIKLAVVTSDIQLNTIKTLEQLGIKDYFDIVIGKDNCTKAKETGEPAEVALKKINSKRENTIMIGDAPMDYYLAKNGNLKDVILTATGQLSKEELLKYSKNTVSSLEEVKIK